MTKNSLLTMAISLLLCLFHGVTSAEGLVGYYSFTGNAQDSSGYGNNGILTGATLTSDRFGNANSACYLGGDGDFITIPDDDSLDMSQAMTLGLWINPASVPSQSYYNIISKGDPPGNGNQAPWQLTLDNHLNLDVYRIADNNYDAENNVTSILLNHWTHIAVTFDLATQKAIVYKNGVLVAEWTKTTPIFVDDVDITIGTQTWNDSVYWNSYTFHGSVDDVAIYNRALSQSEITALMNTAAVPEPASLIIVALATLCFGLRSSRNFFSA